MKKNKKGFLLGEETIKIIIALICIVFLVYLLVSLYYSRVHEEKLRQAQSTLNGDGSSSIKTIISRVTNGQGNIDGNSESLLIHNPKGWTIFSYAGNTAKPNSCKGKSCACICDEINSLSLKAISYTKEERQVLECDENGACLNIESLRSFPNIKISESTSLLIKNDKGIFIEPNGP